MSETKEKDQNLEWDGEQIKLSVKAKVHNLTPKDLLDGLDGARAQIAQMEDQIRQSNEQMKNTVNNLKNAQSFVLDRVSFEEKCIKLQKEKLDLFIRQISADCKKKAEKSAKETTSKDPDAYTEDQIKNMPYLDYQKNLATDPKIAGRISRRIITECLYDKPVFENPFKEVENVR